MGREGRSKRPQMPQRKKRNADRKKQGEAKMGRWRETVRRDEDEARGRAVLRCDRRRPALKAGRRVVQAGAKSAERS